MQLPLAFLDASALEEVPIDLWKDLFQTVGWPSSLEGKRTTFTYDELLTALQRDDLTDALLHALETIHCLGTEAGREAIISAMNDRRVPLDKLPTETGEREFALRLFLRQRGDVSLADVFARAQTHAQEDGEHRRYNEFLAKTAQPVSRLQERKAALESALLQHCRQTDMGDHVQVDAFEDDGVYVFSVLRSDRTKKPLAVVPGHSARATIAFRPVHCDILRYEELVGRLRIAARTASMVEFYRVALGRILFEDESFFSGDPACSLAVLQQRGRAALEDHDVFGVGRVRMTECLWERGDRNLMQLRGSDCFRSIEELGLPIAEGALIQAKLKIEVIGKSTRPVTVTLRVPSRIEVSQKVHEQLVDRVLKAVGIRGARLDIQQEDLWSLYPWRHPTGVWRRLFGAEIDALVRGGALVPIRLDSVPHPQHPESGRVLTAHSLSQGESYGTSRADEIPSRSLSATDLDGLELIPDGFRNYLRSRLAITAGGVTWNGNELLELGMVVAGDIRFYLAYAIRRPTSEIGVDLRARANGAHPVLLVPSSQGESSELASVILETPLPSSKQVLRCAVAACGVGDKVAALHRAPDEARLVVDCALKKVWVDGVEIAGLKPDSHAFRFVELLAQGRGGPVSTDTITTTLSAARQDGNTTARQAKNAAKRIIVEAMAAAGRTFDEDPFPTAGTGFYRCSLPSFVG